jgi:hypothetical protein
MHTDICAASDLAGGGATLSGRAFRRGRRGYLISMSNSSAGDGAADRSDSASHDRVEQRAADLLPEEAAAGSVDPRAQAEAILEESDEREADTEAAPDSFVEHRTSDQTVTPDDATR